MSIQKQVQFIAREHAERVILTDSFGKVHELKIDLLATPDAVRPLDRRYGGPCE